MVCRRFELAERCRSAKLDTRNRTSRYLLETLERSYRLLAQSIGLLKPIKEGAESASKAPQVGRLSWPPLPGHRANGCAHRAWPNALSVANGGPTQGAAAQGARQPRSTPRNKSSRSQHRLARRAAICVSVAYHRTLFLAFAGDRETGRAPANE
jgi:hypothetical protein